MTIQATLTIRVLRISDRIDAGRIVQRLTGFGGVLIAFAPEIKGIPARATFEFETGAQLESFLALALDVPGVSVGTD